HKPIRISPRRARSSSRDALSQVETALPLAEVEVKVWVATTGA
ncbi:hypothetical protein AVEN_33384-1, partial [Araneus ventricosus]